LFAGPLAAQDMSQADKLDGLFERLKVPDLAEWDYIERQIEREWSHSGSAAMDLLLQRGRKAMQDEDYQTAVEHFSALIDHAPDFAEGYNARATAFFAMEVYSLALADVRATLALEPRHFNAWRGLGIMMEQMGRTELARRAFRQAAAIHPNDPAIKEQLERLERQTGELDT